jgi:hypothetical protein
MAKDMEQLYQERLEFRGHHTYFSRRLGLRPRLAGRTIRSV